MSENKMRPTNVSVDDFLSGVSAGRQAEARQLMQIMGEITSQQPVMWGPSIIGFGSEHYRYDTGREGDMPALAFSPRKAAITVYFSEGFESYAQGLDRLGKYKASVSCLYINKLADIDLAVLRTMLEDSYLHTSQPQSKPATVDEYVALVPSAARGQFDALRRIVSGELPHAEEVLSYGIIGYKTDNKRPRVYVSGWKDHVAMYPAPKEAGLRAELKPFLRGSGTLWFDLETPLPEELIRRVVAALVD